MTGTIHEHLTHRTSRKDSTNATHGFMRRALAVLALLAFFGGITSSRISPAAAQATEAGDPVVIVFDSSGSMWGELADNPQPKFALARRAIRENLGEVAGSRPTGLVVFGRSCTTAAFESPVASRPIDDLLRPIDNLNPRGKGPLGLALQNALTAYPAGTPGDIILIHDGADNCGRDICAWAASTAATHPGLRIHQLSVGLSDEDAEATRCIAERTGGTAVRADDAPTIATGLAEIAEQLRAGHGNKSTAPKLASSDTKKETVVDGPAQETAIPVDERPGGKPRLVATASLGPSGAEIPVALAWSIRPSGATDATPPLVSRRSSRLVEELAPGDYALSAHLGAMTATTTVTIGDTGPTRVRLPFDAGVVGIDLGPMTGADGLVVSLTPADATETSAGSADRPAGFAGPSLDNTPLARQETRFDSPIVLPAGRYWLDAQAGQSTDRRLLTVERGSDQRISPFPGYGVLELSITQPAGSTVGKTPLTLLIEADAPERTDGRRVVTRTTAPSSRHLLPAGTYYVTLEVGRRRTSQLVAVPAGQRVVRAFELQSGRIDARISLLPTGMSLRRGTPLTYAVEDLAAPGSPAVAWSADPAPQFHLAPGRYRIIARIGAHNVVAQTDVTLGAGQTAEAVLEGAAAEVRLSIDGGAALTERLWEVRTASGDVVWRANNADPKALLAPGRYVVRCTTGARILEGTFNAEAGTAQTIALVAE